MKEKLLEARRLIDEILSSLEDSPDDFREMPEAPVQVRTESDELKVLKSLLDSPEWPEAVSSYRIADEGSEGDKEERAKSIVDIILPPLMGKKFLDLGCGEGHVARLASGDALFAAGYDLERRGSLGWEERTDNLLLTTDLERVRNEGPYDVILIYDVLDHAENPLEVLFTAKSVLSEEGSIFLRCHPWCSRHGGHLYRKLNKAFAHLVFSEEELRGMGVECEVKQKVLQPMNHYSDMIREAGLSASQPEVEYREVERFFQENPLVKSRILTSFGATEWQYEKPAFQMSQCFLDYVLKG